MHIECNVSKNIIGFLWGTKDSKGVRANCWKMGMHRHAWIAEDENPSDRPPNWQLSVPCRKAMNEMFTKIKLPTGYGAMLRHAAKGKESGPPVGLKSHDHHKMLHHILPMTLRSVVINPESHALRQAIYDLCEIFRY
jgi:hypothetical protein